MRNNEEQIRYMEDLKRKGKLSESSLTALQRLKEHQQESGEENRAHKPREPHVSYHTPSTPPTQGFNLFTSINKAIGNTPQDKAYRSAKKAAYEEEYRRESINVARSQGKRKARSEGSGSHSMGGNFITASLNELGGALQGARAFNEGGGGGIGYGYSEPRSRSRPRQRVRVEYVTIKKKGRTVRHRRVKKRRVYSRNREGWMPEHDLTQFLG